MSEVLVCHLGFGLLTLFRCIRSISSRTMAEGFELHFAESLMTKFEGCRK